MPRDSQLKNTVLVAAAIGAMSCIAYAMMRGTSRFGLWGILTPLSGLRPEFVVVAALAFALVSYAVYARVSGSDSHGFTLPLGIPLLAYVALATNAFATNGLATQDGCLAFEHFAERFGHLFWWLVGCSVIGRCSSWSSRIPGAYIALMSASLMAIVALTDRPDAIWILVAMYALLGFSFFMGRRVREIDQINAIKRTATTAGEQPGAASAAPAVEAISQRYALTKRELEVLTLLVQGWSRDRIAQQLHLAPGTIGSHCAHIYEKTRVRGKQDLLDLVYREIEQVRPARRPRTPKTPKTLRGRIG